MGAGLEAFGFLVCSPSFNSPSCKGEGPSLRLLSPPLLSDALVLYDEEGATAGALVLYDEEGATTAGPV